MNEALREIVKKAQENARIAEEIKNKMAEQVRAGNVVHTGQNEPKDLTTEATK